MLGDDEEGHDPLVAEVGEQFMELGDQEPLLGHRVQVAVQAVDDDHFRPRLAVFSLDGRPDAVGELPRRQLGRVDRLDGDVARVDVLRDVHPEARRPLQDGLEPLVEGEDGGPLAAVRRGPRVLEGERRFAAAGRPEEDRAGAVLEAAAQEGVQLDVAGFEQAPLLAVVMLRGDEPRKDVEASRGDDNGDAGSRHLVSARRGALARPREATKHGGRELRSGRENMVIAEISDGLAEAGDAIRPAFREPVSAPRRGTATRDGAERVDCLARVIIR